MAVKKGRQTTPVTKRAVQETKRLLALGRQKLLELRLGRRWRGSDGGFAHREYPDYETYRRHQRVKFDALRKGKISAHDRHFYKGLRERLQSLPQEWRGKRVLCLAARQGTEVRAFIDEGAFAIGIDLNPGKENRYVVVGDFHELQFADASLDVVFTNSLDHAFDLGRIVAEVQRVLVPGGLLIAEIGTVHGANPGFFESLSWSSPDEVLRRIEAHGFRLERRSTFENPWLGEQFVLRLEP